MPSDRFTNVNIEWRRIDDEENKTIVAAIKLPSQSVIREEVFSDPQNVVRLAKQQAAFKACLQLFKCGELDDNLVPIDDKQKIEMHQEEYFSHWEKYDGDKKSAGTRNHRRYHPIEAAQVLQESSPKIGECSFLYIIHIRPKFEKYNKAINVFYELLNNEKRYGILTSKRIPKLCKMPLFQTFGEIEVELSSVPIPVKLTNEKDLNVLRCFHITLFRDVLRTWENYFAFDKSSFLIVPLNDFEIDWNFAREFHRVEKPRRMSYEEVKEANFSKENYLHFVINPVYRETDQNYVVIEVHDHMSPMSLFVPKPEYGTYKNYVEVTKAVEIYKLDQPLIEVKGISSNLNMFFPGTAAAGKQRKHEKEHATEMYIPEVCHNYKFPADYWLKATMLPSICHRIHYLLNAEKLRNWLIDEGIDQGNGQQVYKLDVDYGNYDQREKISSEDERNSAESYPNPQEIEKLLQLREASCSATKTRHSSAMLVWNESELPIDLDRNWLSVTEVDIIKYCSFLNQYQNQISPSCLNRLEQLNMSPVRRTRAILDSDTREKIAILSIDPAYESVQQKDLIKVITTSNAGKFYKIFFKI